VQPGGPQAQTLQVRVQVIDVRSQTLDLILPTYLPARDLTQRVARDAGLDAFWPDGRRRLYWLRARGRLMRDEERLMDLGVVANELIHLLPEPPAGSGVVEQHPDYPETQGYAARGTLALVGSIFGVLLWTLGWSVALSVDRGLLTTTLPGLGLGLMCTSLARHIFGGDGWRARVAGLGMALAVLMVALAMLGPVLVGEDPALVFSESVPGLVTALAGVLFAWLAWWGAVEPLQRIERSEEVQSEVAAVVACGICGQGVEPHVRMDCVYACGKVFHTGCYEARKAVFRGDPKTCEVCGSQVRA